MSPGDDRTLWERATEFFDRPGWVYVPQLAFVAVVATLVIIWVA